MRTFFLAFILGVFVGALATAYFGSPEAYQELTAAKSRLLERPAQTPPAPSAPLEATADDPDFDAAPASEPAAEAESSVPSEEPPSAPPATASPQPAKPAPTPPPPEPEETDPEPEEDPAEDSPAQPLPREPEVEPEPEPQPTPLPEAPLPAEPDTDTPFEPEPEPAPEEELEPEPAPLPEPEEELEPELDPLPEPNLTPDPDELRETETDPAEGNAALEPLDAVAARPSQLRSGQATDQAKLTGVARRLEAIGDPQIDLQIATAIRAQFKLTRQIDPSAVQIDVEQRAVTLRGTVSSDEAKRLALDTARATKGVAVVRDELKIR